MEILEVYELNQHLLDELVNVWESSVKATHLFLSDSEIENIKKYVPEALKGVEHLVIVKNDIGKAVGFMGINDHSLEMLFISNDYRGQGLGKRLLEDGIKNYAVKKLAVNEQNPQAKGFYEHMGFKVYQRSELDEQGNPYPILYMKLIKD